MRAETIHAVGHYLFKKGLITLSKLFSLLNLLLHNSYIPSSCEIGRGSKFGYAGIGVVIHGQAKIGRGCIIGQGITIGGKSGEGVPIIEDFVYIGPGARVLGGIVVHHHSIIGANAVVLSDVPPYSIVAGIPAKVVQRLHQENYERYRDYLHADKNDFPTL